MSELTVIENANLSKRRFESSSFSCFVERILEILILERGKNSISWDVFIRQMLFTGYEALSLVSLIGLIIGTTVILGGHNLLQNLGETEWVYQILVTTLFRDLGPLVISLILLGRSGIAISTELGILKTHQEVDYIKTLGISPLSYLVIPRVLAMVGSGVLLLIYFSFVGTVGGYAVSSTIMTMDIGIFINQMVNHISLLDLLVIGTKIGLSTFLIGLICTYQGIQVETDITEIPKRNILAVSYSLKAVFLIHSITTLMYYLGRTA